MIDVFAQQYMGQSLPVDSLGIFANQYKTRGEKLVAADTLSRMNDRYYGQWLALNIPFRELDDFAADVEFDCGVVVRLPSLM